MIEKKIANWRLCQICAVTLKGTYELSYSFADEYEFHTLRLVIGTDEEVPSISQVYDCAFLYENEMRNCLAYIFSILRRICRINCTALTPKRRSPKKGGAD